MTVRGQARPIKLSIQLKDTKVSGTVTFGEDKVKIERPAINGKEFSFSIPSEAGDVDLIIFRGSVVDDSMKLSMFGKLKDKTDEVKIAEGTLLRVE